MINLVPFFTTAVHQLVSIYIYYMQVILFVVVRKYSASTKVIQTPQQGTLVES